jgi:chromosome segregation ATPase
VINQVCSAAMLAAYGEGETRVARRHIEGPPQPVEAMPDDLATGEFEIDPELNLSNRIESAIEEDRRAMDDAGINVMESRLASLVQKAERVTEGLMRRTPQAVDAVEQAECKVEQLLGSARERILTLESRLSAATHRAEQAAAQVERAEHAFSRAEQIEIRLTAFADQLAEQMDNVQAHVAEIMKYAAPLDDARSRLEGSIRRADASCGKIEEYIKRGNDRILEQNDATYKTLQRSVSALLETSSQKMRTALDGLQKEGANLIEKSERSIKAISSECQQSVTQMAQTVQSQIDVAARAATDRIVLSDQKIAEAHDSAQASERTIQNAVQKAVRTTDEIKQEIRQSKPAIRRIRPRVANDALTVSARCTWKYPGGRHRCRHHGRPADCRKYWRIDLQCRHEDYPTRIVSGRSDTLARTRGQDVVDGAALDGTS